VAFDNHAGTWEAYTRTPLGQLRQALTLRYLTRHLYMLPPRLEILDAGGGTGGYALALAERGHRVCLLDLSSQMLAVAREKAERLDPSLSDHLCLCQASVDDIPALFGPDHFDLVLCHTLLKYVSEPWGTLRDVVGVLRPGGLLSVLTANTYADALRWAIVKGDLERARLALQPDSSHTDLFGLPRRTFRPEAVREAMMRLGVRVVEEHGVRIFADYVPAGQLTDPDCQAQLAELEAAASTLAPYRQIARYNLIVGTKTGR
jgi:SAM-dependent methyltransferase